MTVFVSLTQSRHSSPLPYPLPTSHLGVCFRLWGPSDLDCLINGLDGSQLVRLKERHLLVLGHRCTEKHPAAPMPTKPPTFPGISDIGEINAGMEDEGWGGSKPLAKPYEIFLLPSSFFDFVCARCRFPGQSFSAQRQIPAVLTDSPDLITVNEAAKTFRSK